MKKRFLSFISFIYMSIFIYAILTGSIKNFLAPNMQLYLKLSIIPLFIIGIVLFIKESSYKFKISDLFLLLPILFLILAGDGRLTTSFSQNRMTNFSKEKKVVDKKITEVEEKNVDNNDEVEIDSNQEVYFDVIDENYEGLANYITYDPNAVNYIGKKIKVRGFVAKYEDYIPDGYFAIGKYVISCCAADAGYLGFIIKYNPNKVDNNKWYEIEGILVKSKDKEKNDIVAIQATSIKEIDEKSEEEYIYPCFSYGDGNCEEITKYNLKY